MQASKVIVWPLTLWSPFQQVLLFSAHTSGRSWTHLQGDAMHIRLLQKEMLSRVARQGHGAQRECVPQHGSRTASMQAVKACQ